MDPRPSPYALEDRNPKLVKTILTEVAAGATPSQIEQKYGIDHQTLDEFKNRLPGWVSLVEPPQTLADMLPNLINRSARAFNASDKVIDEAPLHHRAIFGGICVDKALLLQNRPTAIIGHLHEHRHHLGDLAEAIRETIEARRVTSGIGADDHNP